jgi:hypothetical protein
MANPAEAIKAMEKKISKEISTMPPFPSVRVTLVKLPWVMAKAVRSANPPVISQ